MKPLPNAIKKLIRLGLQEDAARQDITTKLLIPARLKTKAFLILKEKAVLYGFEVVREVFKTLNPEIKFKKLVSEGRWIEPGTQVAHIHGLARPILSGERVALNFLQQLSGVATLTRKFVDQIDGNPAKILDTRKTTPGFRWLEKQAVRAGGGINHRQDLKSGIMIKDNHWQLMGPLESVSRQVKKLAKSFPKVLEVESLEDLKKALKLGFRYIQLDNMSKSQLRQAVAISSGQCQLEATGGVTLKNVRAIAQCGVDFISIGALTHSAPAIDIAMEISSQ